LNSLIILLLQKHLMKFLVGGHHLVALGLTWIDELLNPLCRGMHHQKQMTDNHRQFHLVEDWSFLQAEKHCSDFSPLQSRKEIQPSQHQFLFFFLVFS
jgi:hypothetical protein